MLGDARALSSDGGGDWAETAQPHARRSLIGGIVTWQESDQDLARACPDGRARAAWCHFLMRSRRLGVTYGVPSR